MKQWEKKRQGGRVSNSPLRASQHSGHFKGSEKYRNSNAYLTQPSPNPLVTLPLHSKAINTYTRWRCRKRSLGHATSHSPTE